MQSIDTVGRSVEVIFNGDTEVVRVPYRSIAPAAVGQIVAIEGNSPDNYLADVAGANSTDVALAALFEATAANVPWTQPTLGSGCTHVSGNPIRYRVVTDRGSSKIQLRGSCNTTSAATTVFTMPVGMRRATYTSLVISRNISGGSNTAVLGVNTTGAMVLDGKTTGADSGVTDVGGSGSASVKRQTTQPTTAPNNTGYAATSAVSRGTAGDNGHIHNFDHIHDVTVTGMSHQHNVPSPLAPTSISLDGVEYFL